ncbi:hypothetical protein BDQ94DRAFT_143370 [Aspergillus welwitschiae]|uniref:Uncharacterized protein n=1 Tax=Aspergillus welwitschiae TaxID=1341132 RepID=A0A3F3Q333_9EURO|nr:hypothetical protein BDQ94DRAFT_143370 [Aspergillus welwitschiae]RDH33583.1 hypothetical protein BDQ94DRAFT_143370 [Aspergillus welwitschiae]
METKCGWCSIRNNPGHDRNKQKLPGRSQPSAHRTILNIGIWYHLLHVEDSITMIALPAEAMWLKGGAKQKPERNPGRELISHMPIRDS